MNYANGRYRLEQSRPQPTPPKEFPFFRLINLPDASLELAWDGLIGVDATKDRLLRYLNLLQWFGSEGIPNSEIARGNASLLAGPPGTGKSVLAMGAGNAWAKKFGEPAILLKVDAHRLPSANRGGSQQNVLKLMGDISTVAECGSMVLVIIDEVESIAGNRAALDPKTNPADTAYAVNAFIEGLDDIASRHPNVIFLFTTNLPRAIDKAIADRADFSITTMLPNEEARAQILASALAPIGDAIGITFIARPENGSGSKLSGGHVFREIVSKTEALSAREIKKLVIRGMTYAEAPIKFVLEDLLEAVKDFIAQRKHHEKNGGAYGYDYQRDTRPARQKDSLPPKSE